MCEVVCVCNCSYVRTVNVRTYEYGYVGMMYMCNVWEFVCICIYVYVSMCI